MASRTVSCLRIVLADDHVIVRQGIKALLQQDGLQIVGEASNGYDAVRCCTGSPPDIAILDIAMPLLNGIDAARELAKQHPTIKVILLSMYSDQYYVLASLRVGVRGYVLKNNAALNLLQAIEAVMQGEMYFSPGVSGAVVQAYLDNAPPAADPLSPREREVLQLIAEGKTMKEIGGMLGISARTAESHRARIMSKLKISDVAGLVRYAISHGLITVESATAGDARPAALPPTVA
jgi:DNA-binding NarL/FixJ family response regulator